MFKKYKLWGETEASNQTNESKRYNYENIIESAKNHNLLKKYMKILPSEGNDLSPAPTSTIRIPGMDPRILHTIALHDHRNTIQDLIDLKMRRGSGKSFRKPHPTPPFPRLNRRNKQKQKQNKYNLFGNTPEIESTQTVCLPGNIPNIRYNVRKKILRQCIATLFAHVGYEYCAESILEALEDILDEFLSQITMELKKAVDLKSVDITDEETVDISAELQKVFQTMGLGTFSSLSSYYQSRVIKYEKLMYQQSQESLLLLNDLEGPYEKADSMEPEKEEKPRIHIMEFFGSITDEENKRKDIPVIHLSEEAGSDFIELLDDLEQKTEETLKDAERMLCRTLFNRMDSIEQEKEKQKRKDIPVIHLSEEAGSDFIELLDDLEEKTEETLKDAEQMLSRTLFNRM